MISSRKKATLPSYGICQATEWESLALNYTPGTTGRPKGVVYHHRGAYLMTYVAQGELAHGDAGLVQQIVRFSLQRLGTIRGT